VPIRLIALDIDGTLLDSRHQVPEGNRAAIAEAVARGFEVAFVTGRRFDFALPIIELVTGAPPAFPVTMIVNNGALVKSNDGATHLRQLLPRATARRLLLHTPGYRDGAMVMFDRPRENQVLLERIPWDDPARKGYFERNLPYLAEMAPLEDCLTEDPIQVMFTGGTQRMRGLLDDLRLLPWAGDFSCALTEYEARDFSLVDVLRPGCSKGSTLAEWTRRRGWTRDNVLAIGDNWNDREMLEFAGTPVVMGNAVPALKELGWPVTAGNDECGVAQAIERFAFDGRRSV